MKRSLTPLSERSRRRAGRVLVVQPFFPGWKRRVRVDLGDCPWFELPIRLGGCVGVEFPTFRVLFGPFGAT